MKFILEYFLIRIIGFASKLCNKIVLFQFRIDKLMVYMWIYRKILIKD